MQSTTAANTITNSMTTPSTLRLVKALKKLQLETTINEAAFFREAHMLQANKYHLKNQSIMKRRTAIINGDYEPTDNECEWTLDDGDLVDSDELETVANFQSVAPVSGK